jgi:hypothetical protein
MDRKNIVKTLLWFFHVDGASKKAKEDVFEELLDQFDFFCV